MSSAASDMTDSPTGSPSPSTPPTSPSKSTPPTSPKKAAAAAKKDEASRKREVEKIKKWRNVQRGKVLKSIEKHEPKAKILLEKLSTVWDSYGLAVHQLKLLDEERVDDAEGLKEKTQAYEDGEEMLRDFVGWVEKVYTPDEDADAEVEKMHVDEKPDDDNNDDGEENGGEEDGDEDEDDQ